MKQQFLDLTGLKELVNSIKQLITNHTHKYAGSATEGGTANSAAKLETARKIGKASFDGTNDISLSQMGALDIIDITREEYDSLITNNQIDNNAYYNVTNEFDSVNVINDSLVQNYTAFSSDKSEKTYAKKSIITTATLSANKWTGSSAPYSYILSVSGVTASNIVEIDYASNASSQAIEAYQEAMLADGGQAIDQITINATEKPTVDIPIIIVVRNDGDLVEQIAEPEPEPELPKKYTIYNNKENFSLSNGHGGTCDSLSFNEGEAVNVTLVTSGEFKNVDVTITDVDGNNFTDFTYTTRKYSVVDISLTMPNKDLYITAKFVVEKPKYNVTTTYISTTTTSYEPGSHVNFRITNGITNNPSVTVTDSNGNLFTNYTFDQSTTIIDFIMPETNLTIILKDNPLID